MVLKTTLKKSKILYLLFVLPLFLNPYTGTAQTRIYASTATTSNIPLSPNEVLNPASAYDGVMTTAAQVRASSGVALGIGQYAGHIELIYPSMLPANTTSYVKITTQDNLLPALLGGSLGGLLADVLGAVLLGNQEFTIAAKDGPLNADIVLDGESQIDSDFATDRLRIVRNAAGDFLVAITPAVPYDRIRVTNRVGSLLGLGNTKTLNVFETYYVSDPANCGSPAYTSFSGTGITLDLLQLGTAGVQNPQNAIDASTTNFSTLSLGILGVGSSVEQTVYFEGLSNATDQFAIRVRLAQTLLNLDVINEIRVITSNGGVEVSNQSLATLLTLSLLSPPGGNVITTIPVNPGAPVDRVTLRFYSFVSASVTQSIDFFGVTRTVAPPTITLPTAGNYTGCENKTASLIATTNAGNELRWYTAPTGGVATIVASGDPYVTSVLTATTTFYVAAAKIGCPEESSRVAVKVTVTPVDTPTTLDTTPEFCSFNNPTVADLQVNEPDVSFYDAPTDGNLIPSNTPLEDNKIYYASLTDAATGCGSTTRLAITVDLLTLCDVTLNLKVMLQGALFNATGGLMRDDLRVGGYIPLVQPYSSVLNARFAHVGGGGTEVTTTTVLQANAGTGNAIVDWVFVEIRDDAIPLTVLKTVSALLQRDGDIVAANGGPLMVSGLPATFKISVKHRNHLGALGSQTLTAVNQQVTLDFTTLADADIFTLTGFTGQEAMTTVGSIRALYCSNANYDGQVKYDGLTNDRQISASQVLSFPGNASQILNYANATGYFSGDINMDGKVLYDGANNDRQIMLNIIVTYPLNTSVLANYNGMFEQMPQ